MLRVRKGAERRLWRLSLRITLRSKALRDALIDHFSLLFSLFDHFSANFCSKCLLSRHWICKDEQKAPKGAFWRLLLTRSRVKRRSRPPRDAVFTDFTDKISEKCGLDPHFPHFLLISVVNGRGTDPPLADPLFLLISALLTTFCGIALRSKALLNQHFCTFQKKSAEMTGPIRHFYRSQ